MIVGAYDLTLYCAKRVAPFNRFAADTLHPKVDDGIAAFTGQNQQDAKRSARKLGWRFIRIDGLLDVLCPSCSSGAA